MISEEFEKTLMEIIKSLEERGYNPYEQLKGYVSLGDDSYITRHGDAREKIKNLDREQISNYLREKDGDEMPRQFKTARKMCQLKLMDAAEKLGVSQPTLSSWESGRKSPTIESILKMSQLYNVSTDFLLGKTLDGCGTVSNETHIEHIPEENLCVLHGMPVWSDEYGWLLVDAINECFIAPDSLSIPFEKNIQVYYKLDTLVEGPAPTTEALALSKLSEYDRVWVEPISANFHLRQELRGWYTVMSNWVENSAGNRFLFDTYASKWLAFSEL